MTSPTLWRLTLCPQGLQAHAYGDGWAAYALRRHDGRIEMRYHGSRRGLSALDLAALDAALKGTDRAADR